ncbi:MAG: ABC transporter permease, partial [Gemmatimonadaceae bacterium]
MSEVLRDLKHAMRRLARTPMFSVATITTLALGIGANVAVFSVIYGVMLKPLPYREPDQLIAVWQTAPGVDIKDLNASVADYVTYREHSQTFADVALWNGSDAIVSENGIAERVSGASVTHRMLPLLGVQPLLGRGFVETDDAEGSAEVVMLGYGYWQQHFGGDRNIVGRRITIDGNPVEVIGVLPQSFWLLDTPLDVITPLRFNRASVHLAGYSYQAIARLKPGITIAQANRDVARMIALELTLFPPPDGMSVKQMQEARLGPNVRLLKDDFLGDIGRSLWVVMATIGMVLLIACANVANLLLVRSEGRSRELAVRLALGAGRARLAREMFVESFAVAFMGGALGVLLASLVISLTLNLIPARLPRLDQVSVDVTTLLFALAVSVVVGVALGALPVLKQGNLRITDALRAGGRNASAGREKNFARGALTVLQVALALVLLVGSGLMVRTFASIRRVQPGFSDPSSLAVMRISIPQTEAKSDTATFAMQRNIINRLQAVVGVSSVGMMNGLPMTGFSSQDPIFASDHSYTENQIPPLRLFLRTGPNTFRTLGTAIVAGREFTWDDLEQDRKTALISENFAREYWHSAAAAVGQRIRTNPAEPWSEVIGVVSDVRHDGVDKPAPATVYWPERGIRSMTYLVRSTRVNSQAYTNELRAAVRAASASIPVTDMSTMQTVYDKSMSRTAFILTLLAVSGGMALLLAVVGVYAVISYTVAQRTREIGIRIALGAQQRGVQLMFVRNGLVLAGIGAGAGVIVAMVVARVLSSLLFEISPIDPLTYVLVVVGLLSAAALASYL